MTVESRKMACKRKREEELADEQRDWRNLPKDVLFEIYQRLDDKTMNKLELQRLRSVCSSWRSSLLPLTSSTTLQFPLKLPQPMILANDSDKSYTTASLSQSSLLLFPPLGDGRDQGSGWIVKVERRVESSKWRIENPFHMLPAYFEHPTLFTGFFDIFDCNVKEICRSYSLEYSVSNVKNTIQAKAVLSWNNDDFTVLALFHRGKLGLWRPGEATWSIIPSLFTQTLRIDDQYINVTYSDFCDIITFQGKFYATTTAFRLIMIDPTTYELNHVITVEQGCFYDELVSHLVESNGCLYLVCKDATEPEEPGAARVFVLDVNPNNMANDAYCWNVINNIEDCVFFASDYVNFSISAEDLGLSKGNYVILPFEVFCGLFSQWFFDVDEDLIDEKLESSGGPWAQYYADCLYVYNLQDSNMSFGRDEVHQFAKIFWPPPEKLLQLHFNHCPQWNSVSSVCSAASKIENQ